MSILLKNALLFDHNPIAVELGDILIEGAEIRKRGAGANWNANEVIDCDGAVVMPGLVNGHTHLYSALAVGMPPPARAPENFLQILQEIWWKLDQSLDAESIEISARIGAVQAAQCGTTALIDHHASPNCIGGSLDLIENGIKSVGLRGVLCYETTDRHGRAGRDAGLAENRRFVEKCRLMPGKQFAGMIGAHASFTLDDESIDQIVTLANDLNTGVHIHVAEDPCDEQSCLSKHGVSLIDRLVRHGVLSPSSILAHCIHLDDRAAGLMNNSGIIIAHNPRSNMNNAVGYARLDSLRVPVLLGTDGIGADLFAEAQHAWFKSRDAGMQRSPDDIIGMLRASAQTASNLLGVSLGNLRPGAAADLIITEYRPVTPLNRQNCAAHFLYAMSSRHVKDVMVAGNWVVRNHSVVSATAQVAPAVVQEVVSRLWRAVSELQSVSG